MKKCEIKLPYLNFFKAKITLEEQDSEIKKVFKQKAQNNKEMLGEKNSDEWLQEYFIIYNSYKYEE